jgi:hypothetical protein
MGYCKMVIIGLQSTTTKKSVRNQSLWCLVVDHFFFCLLRSALNKFSRARTSTSHLRIRLSTSLACFSYTDRENGKTEKCEVHHQRKRAIIQKEESDNARPISPWTEEQPNSCRPYRKSKRYTSFIPIGRGASKLTANRVVCGNKIPLRPSCNPN